MSIEVFVINALQLLIKIRYRILGFVLQYKMDVFQCIQKNKQKLLFDVKIFLTFGRGWYISHCCENYYLPLIIPIFFLNLFYSMIIDLVFQKNNCGNISHFTSIMDVAIRTSIIQIRTIQISNNNLFDLKVILIIYMWFQINLFFITILMVLQTLLNG